MKKLQSQKPRQVNALQLLVMGKPVCEVARIVSVSTMTVSNVPALPGDL